MTVNSITLYLKVEFKMPSAHRNCNKHRIRQPRLPMVRIHRRGQSNRTVTQVDQASKTVLVNTQAAQAHSAASAVVGAREQSLILRPEPICLLKQMTGSENRKVDTSQDYSLPRLHWLAEEANREAASPFFVAPSDAASDSRTKQWPVPEPDDKFASSCN